MFPQCSHITRKRGVYHFRKRFPGRPRGEVTVSLATRSFREAEHRAEMLSGGFIVAWERALVAEKGGADLAGALRDYLKGMLDRDLERRLERQPGQPVYAHWWEPGDPGTAAAADLDAIRNARDSMANDLAQNTPGDMLEAEADALLARYGLPTDLRRSLVVGMLEATVQGWNVAARRTLGTEPLVFDARTPDAPPPPTTPPPVSTPATAQPPPAKPLAASLVDPFMVRREGTDRATSQVMNQERGTLRRFIEACGDRPVNEFGRGDVTGFMDTLRRLPNTYGKAPRDKDRSLAEIIAEADAIGGERLKDKTVKRHLSALSQFFQFAVDAGHLTVTARNEMVEGHRFRAGEAAREQRDEWSSADLAKLFASPVWTGSHDYFRTQPGTAIIRDARFWLPILALHHGARLEEFADLYRRDVGREGGTWFLRITETEDRRLKTANAERVLPLHPELVKLGFLDYIQAKAPNPDDPLFPDLEPQGKDRKRGPRFTRWFVEYRKAVGVFRDGVGMHAFRHTAITRLRNTIQDHQQDRHIDFMMGHASGGGEGRTRYDKGPGLKAAAETLALLCFPEAALAHLHTQAARNAETAPPGAT